MCNLGVHIDVLGLAHVEKITDRAVVQLVRSCNKLRNVDLARVSLFLARFFMILNILFRLQ